MPELVCPVCRADIEPDLLEQTGNSECPFCGADVSQLPLETPVSTMGLEARPELLNPMESSANRADSAASVSRELPPLPAGSKLQVIEADDERLILYIPAGGKSVAGFGVFALVWNGFMAVLRESYSENDVPVYHVAVDGTNGTAKFGTPLSEAEKNWLVKIVNDFLGVLT
jgi:hypothetical protein